MHVCPECGKAMATAGGLEIHTELAHSVAPEPEPPVAPALATSAPDAPVQSTVWPPLPAENAPMPGAKTYKPVLRGWDPTLPLTAILVLGMLVAGIGSAVHRSTTHPASSVSVAAPQLDEPTPTIAGGQPQTAAGAATPREASTPSSCSAVVNSLTARPSTPTIDAAELIKANALPSLPLPGFAHPTPRYTDIYGSLQQYIDEGLDPADPSSPFWEKTLRDNGFVSAVSTQLIEAGTAFGATAFRFATPAGAAAFNRATLTESCAEGILENPRPMPGLSGGMNYVINEPGPPFRASFVAGDTVMRMNICHCAQSPDNQALAGQWAQSIAARIGAA